MFYIELLSNEPTIITSDDFFTGFWSPCWNLFDLESARNPHWTRALDCQQKKDLSKLLHYKHRDKLNVIRYNFDHGKTFWSVLFMALLRFSIKLSMEFSRIQSNISTAVTLIPLMSPFVSIWPLLTERAVTVKLFQCLLLAGHIIYTPMSTWEHSFIRSRVKQWFFYLSILWSDYRRRNCAQKLWQSQGINVVVPTNRLIFTFLLSAIVIVASVFWTVTELINTVNLVIKFC